MGHEDIPIMEVLTRGTWRVMQVHQVYAELIFIAVGMYLRFRRMTVFTYAREFHMCIR